MKKRYVDGFVLPVPKKKLATYKKLAAQAGKAWIRLGALQYVECVGKDMKSAGKCGCLPFPKMAKAKASEVVIFSYIVYKSKAQRDRVNAKVMKDPAMNELCGAAMPFEMKRMAAGGFETLVSF